MVTPFLGGLGENAERNAEVASQGSYASWEGQELWALRQRDGLSYLRPTKSRITIYCQKCRPSR
jgi:hypothetical protein